MLDGTLPPESEVDNNEPPAISASILMRLRTLADLLHAGVPSNDPPTVDNDYGDMLICDRDTLSLFEACQVIFPALNIPFDAIEDDSIGRYMVVHGKEIPLRIAVKRSEQDPVFSFDFEDPISGQAQQFTTYFSSVFNLPTISIDELVERLQPIQDMLNQSYEEDSDYYQWIVNWEKADKIKQFSGKLIQAFNRIPLTGVYSVNRDTATFTPYLAFKYAIHHLNIMPEPIRHFFSKHSAIFTLFATDIELLEEANEAFTGKMSLRIGY